MNEILKNRISAIRNVLMSLHSAGNGLPSDMIGHEREYIIDNLLSEVLPGIYRFGTGSITDSTGKISGQVDIVIELPIGLTFPIPSGGQRLYTAETVCAVIEVKSNIISQWDQLAETTRKVKQLNRDIRQPQLLALESSPDPEIELNIGPKIPVFAIGYKGHKTIESLKGRIKRTSKECRPDGVVVIESGCFVGQSGNFDEEEGIYMFIYELLSIGNEILGVAYPPMAKYFS